MKTFRILVTVTALIMFSSVDSNAQSVLKRVGKAAERAAERTLERKTEQKTEEAVGKAVDKATDPNTYKGDGNDSPQQQQGGNVPAETSAGQQSGQNNGTTGDNSPKAKEMAWSKFDFVAGDEIIFADDQANEQMGEFPSQWDALAGSAEIISIDGVKGFEILNRGTVVPLMKNQKNYLPDMFTIEFDVFIRDSKVYKDNSYGGDWVNGWYYITFYDTNNKDCFQIRFTPQTRDWGTSRATVRSSIDYNWKVGDENRSGETQELVLTTEDWHHLSFSFNQRAMKLYLDQTRMLNIPNMNKPAYFQIRAYTDAEKLYFVKDVRIAKGAVPLYDRMMTDGKFITYGITFDVGKSTIKPESMGEINRIVTLMTENPDLKFSVEGHTDSTGNAATNQTLSEARSQAIVAKLVETGISADRLSASGKGQNSPIADNSTDEGRAKNRRVEFVKL